MMKRLIFTVIFISAAFSVNAQTDYYAGKDFIRVKDVVYKIRRSCGALYIEDSTNVSKIRRPEPAAETPPRFRPLGGVTRTLKLDVSTVYDIIYEIFPASEIEYLKNHYAELSIQLSVDPQTEKIYKLQFIFIDRSYLRFMPPKRLYSLEQKIKQNIKIPIPEGYGRDAEWIWTYSAVVTIKFKDL